MSQTAQNPRPHDHAAQSSQTGTMGRRMMAGIQGWWPGANQDVRGHVPSLEVSGIRVSGCCGGGGGGVFVCSHNR